MLNKIKEIINPKYKPNQKEKLIIDIIQNMCDQSDTDIRMAPITGRYYIVNKRLEYWVKVYDDGISITNHKFTFTNHASQLFQSVLIKIIQKTMENHRNEFESTVFQNEMELLENIFNNIKEPTKK